MENQNQKWVNLSFVAAAMLVAFLIFTFSNWVAGVYDLETKVRSIDLVVQGAAIGIGLLLFAILYKNHNVNQFMNEVVAELGRVTWPAQRETASATAVVIIMVLVSGVILGFLDYFWTVLLRMVL